MFILLILIIVFSLFFAIIIKSSKYDYILEKDEFGNWVPDDKKLNMGVKPPLPK